MSTIPPEENSERPEHEAQPIPPHGGLSDAEWRELDRWYYSSEDLRLDNLDDMSPEELQPVIAEYREWKKRNATEETATERIEEVRQTSGTEARALVDGSGETGEQEELRLDDDVEIVDDGGPQIADEESATSITEGTGASPEASDASVAAEEDTESAPTAPKQPALWRRISRRTVDAAREFGRKRVNAMAAGVAGYRQARARWKKTGHAIDRGVRGTVTGGFIGGPAWYVMGSQWAQNALYVGSSVANIAGAAVPALPLAYRPVRVGNAWWRRGKQREDFERCERDELHMTDEQIEENEKVFQRELGQPTVELIDEPGEQELLEAFHMFMRDRLAAIPHLVTAERYARYCFTVLVQACTEIKAKNDADRSKAEKRLLAAAEASSSHGEVTHLRQVAIAYGKLLAERERKEDECYTTGAIAGASVGLTLTYGPLAPVVGAAAWGGRKLWRAHLEKQVHIEINERNELVGKNGQPIYSPTTYRSDVPSLYSDGDFVTQAEDDATRKAWHEEEGVKTWLKRIIIPAESVQRCRTGVIRTPRALALEAAPRVQEHLKNQRIEHRPPVDTSKVREIEMEIEAETEDLKNLRAQRSPSKDALDQCAARLKELRKALSDAKNPKPRSGPDGTILPLTIEEIGKNTDACKAFAVAVVEAFQANAKQGWVRKKTGEALAPVSSALKEAIVEVVVKPVIVGGMSVGGVFLVGQLIGLVGGFAVSTPLTLTIGGAVGIYAIVQTAANAIKEFRWGRGAQEKKESEKK